MREKTAEKSAPATGKKTVQKAASAKGKKTADKSVSAIGASNPFVASSPSSKPEVKPSPEATSSKKPSFYSVPTYASAAKTNARPKSGFNSKPKVLYVADSLGHSASMRKLENLSKVRTNQAYSSGYDETARWPEYNFTACVDYTLKNPGSENFDVLLMSAPTVDISNMDTSKMNPKDSTETFQLMDRKSSHNMFRLAERSLKPALAG